MRLEPIAPTDLDDEQRALDDEMQPMVAEHLQGFVSHDADGALIGPFAPMLHWPAWGRGAWAQARSLMDRTVLPKPAHEVAILVTGTAFRAAYELYAHERVAGSVGLSAAKIASIVAGQRPVDLDAEEAAAYDLAGALTRGGPVADATFAQAQRVFGDEGAAEVVFLVSAYCAVSVLLNGFAMPVPDDSV